MHAISRRSILHSVGFCAPLIVLSTPHTRVVTLPLQTTRSLLSMGWAAAHLKRDACNTALPYNTLQYSSASPSSSRDSFLSQSKPVIAARVRVSSCCAYLPRTFHSKRLAAAPPTPKPGQRRISHNSMHVPRVAVVLSRMTSVPWRLMSPAPHSSSSTPRLFPSNFPTGAASSSLSS